MDKPLTFRSFVPAFSEASVWLRLLDAGLVPDLSNSFLFIGSDTPAKVDSAASFYSTERLHTFQHQIVFETGDHRIVARRSRLNNDPIPTGPALWKPDSENFHHGAIYANRCREILSTPNWTIDDLASWAALLQQYLLSRSLPVGFGQESTPMLQGGDIDCTPRNIAVDANGEFHWFDREFRWKENLPLRYVLFRGVYAALAALNSVAPTTQVVDFRISAISRDVLHKLGVELSEADFWDCLERESEFHSIVLGVQPDPRSMAAQSLTVRSSSPAEYQERSTAERDLLALQQHLSDLEWKVKRTADEHAAAQSACREATLAYEEPRAVQRDLETSRSWRLTKPLRVWARLFRR